MTFLGLDRHKQKILTYFGARYVDTNCFLIRKKSSERANLVGYVGRMSAEKGILNLLQAIPRVLEKHKDVEFVIVGDGPLFNTADKALSKIKGNIRIEKWIPHKKLVDFYNEIKILVLPSYTEGLPAVVEEAMACGAIVLATPVGGVPDLIQDEKTGFIMENNSPECILKNIERILENPYLDTIASNARNLLVQEYSFEALSKRSKKVLEYLTQKQGTRHFP
jgi:glycosyltransferase involved in cell wall biosynthesis